jgi:diguanylate cyclase (GGDEF)-like protein/PAS domain S-box-containing protein
MVNTQPQQADPLDLVNSVVLRMDTEGRITFFNAFAQSFFGFSEEEILGRSVVGTIFPPNDAAGRDLRAMIREIGTDPELYRTSENENVRKDGSTVWIAWSNTPIRGSEGRVKEVLCVGNDITPRFEAEQALRRLGDLQSLIARIAGSFLGLRPSETEGGMVATLEAVGSFLGANRGLVLEFEPGSYRVCAFAPWHAPEASAFDEALVGMEIDREFPWFIGALRSGEVVNVPDVLDLPEQAAQERQVLSSSGVRSLLALPLRTAGETMGCFVLEHAGSPIAWPRESMALMRILGSVVTDALARKRVVDERERLASRQRALLENMPAWVFLKDLDGRYTAVNQAYLDVLPRGAADPIGRTDAELFPARLARKFAAEDRQVAETGMPLHKEESVRLRDGRLAEVAVTVSPVLSSSGQVTGLVGMALDITERKNTERELRASEERFRSLVENAEVGVYRRTVGPDAAFVEANPTMARMFGFESVEEFLRMPVADLYPDPEDRQEFVRSLAERGYVNDTQLRLLRRDGTHIWVSVSARAHYEAGRLRWLDGVMVDVSARRAAYERLRHIASHDALTGLYNRAQFEEELSKEVRSAARYQYPLSLCICDLDGFKGINDTYGHATGDAVLVAFAGLVREVFRESDVSGRLGGDEFVIMFAHTQAVEAASAVGRLRRKLEGMALTADDGCDFRATATFGFADFGDAMDPAALIALADEALYEAKRAGRNKICLRTPDGTSTFLE